MSPREIAEKLHDHYCVQECRWHDKPGIRLEGEAEIIQAIDSATKALVEALRGIRDFLDRDEDHPLTQVITMRQIARAAIFAYETQTCFRSGKCKQPRNHDGPCDDWIAEANERMTKLLERGKAEGKESLPKASEGA